MIKNKIEVHLPEYTIRIGTIDRSTVSDELIQYLDDNNYRAYEYKLDQEESLYSVEYSYSEAVRLIESGMYINQNILDELKELEDVCVEHDFAYIRFINL